jgi:hypothetical protein
MRRATAPVHPALLLVVVLSVLPLSTQLLQADAAPDLRKELLAATVRALELEIQATEGKLKAAGEGTGPGENVARFRQELHDLEAELARFRRMNPEEYPAPVRSAVDPGLALETSAGFGPVFPPEIRDVMVTIDRPAADGALLAARGASKSGPFYHLAGIAGGDYGALKPGRKLRLELCLVYRREYFGLIGDYYVYVMSLR